MTESTVPISVTLALAKGRILEEMLPLLHSAGIELLEDPQTSRKLILPTSDPSVRVVVVRASDVPTYVEYGGADLGVSGKDTLLEHAANQDGSSRGAGLYQPLDLGIGRCHMAVAVPKGFDYVSAIRQGSRITVATKYPHITRHFFADKGVHVDLVKLYGSMELAPLTGLADAIVDLVSTGKTLKANNLVEVEHIMDISSHLVINQAALKLKTAPIRKIVQAFERAVGQ
jgi:ATP phosphoribosyltransferase